MLMAFGMFTFEIGSAPYQELARKTEWRFAQTERFGERAATQVLGPGADTITLTGIILPGLAGRHSALRTLREMGNDQQAQPLVDANGQVHGDYIMTGLDETQSLFIDTGEPRRADFSIQLVRVA